MFPHFRRLLLLFLAVLCLWALTPGIAAAQVQAPALPAGPVTLAQVLDLAETRSESIALAQAGVRRAQGEQIRARSGRYPQLSASGSYDRSISSEFEGVFDDGFFGGGGEEPPADGGGLDDLPFGRDNTWRVSVSLNQTLYSGGRLGALSEVAMAGREAAELDVATSRAQLLYDVTQAYYDAALSDRLVAIAHASLQQAAATLQQIQVAFEAGTQPEFEVLRARVARDNLTPALIRQRASRELALLRLKQLLDLPQDYDLRLADALSDDRLAPPAPFAPRLVSVEAELQRVDAVSAPLAIQPDGLLPERTAVAEAATAVRLRDAALELAEAERKPTVSLNSTYSRIGYPSGFLPAFDRENWSVGASVSVPILTGGRQRGDEQVARAELEQAQLQLRQTEELAALDTRSALTELVAARAAWEANAGTVEQAARAYQIADVRYRAGVSTQLELSDARLLLQQAEANRAQAARDLQVARARVALLPDLPLTIGGAAPRAPQPPTAMPQPAPARPQQLPAGGDVTNASAQSRPSQVGTR